MAEADRYRKHPGKTLREETREVQYCREDALDRQAVQFWCPCSTRLVYVTSPPHGIEFDAAGLLTIKGSCGYAAKQNMHPPRPDCWCHFHIEGGEPAMCDDARCPGGDGSIP